MELKKLIELQNSLKERIVLEPFNKDFSLILAVDSSYSKRLNKIISVALVYNKNEKRVVEKHYSLQEINFPYIPGFLSFREIDNTLIAVNKIKGNYDIVMVDGQGIAHPRNFGLHPT